MEEWLRSRNKGEAIEHGRKLEDLLNERKRIGRYSRGCCVLINQSDLILSNFCESHIVRHLTGNKT